MVVNELDFVFQCNNGGGFDGEHISGLEIEGLELESADIASAYMQDCKFVECKFINCSFELTDFSGVVFDSCDLTGTSFDSAAGEDVKFLESLLVGTTFDNADFNGLRIYGCHGPIDFADSNLINSSLTYSSLALSDFSGAKLSDVLFEGADLESIVLTMETRVDSAVKFVDCEVTAVHFAILRGFEASMLENCIAWPFAAAGMQALYDMYEQQKSDFDGGTHPEVNLSIYKGVDKSAHLYCSDIEEYRRYM